MTWAVLLFAIFHVQNTTKRKITVGLKEDVVTYPILVLVFQTESIPESIINII